MKGRSLNYHLGRRGPERRGGDGGEQGDCCRSSHASFTRLVAIKSTLITINIMRIGAALLVPVFLGCGTETTVVVWQWWEEGERRE